MAGNRRRESAMAGPGGRPSHLVRPRWVWGGLAVAIIGMCVVAVGVIVLSLVWSLVGCVVGVAGGLTMLRGGVMNDVGGVSRSELDDVIHGGTHQGQAPGDMISDPRTEREEREP